MWTLAPHGMVLGANNYFQLQKIVFISILKRQKEEEKLAVHMVSFPTWI